MEKIYLKDFTVVHNYLVTNFPFILFMLDAQSARYLLMISKILDLTPLCFMFLRVTLACSSPMQTFASKVSDHNMGYLYEGM